MLLQIVYSCDIFLMIFLLFHFAEVLEKSVFLCGEIIRIQFFYSFIW
jgi:hypothetical protein